MLNYFPNRKTEAGLYERFPGAAAAEAWKGIPAFDRDDRQNSPRPATIPASGIAPKAGKSRQVAPVLTTQLTESRSGLQRSALQRE